MDHPDAPFPDLVGTLAVRVSSTGAKSWVVFYRCAGKQRRRTLGRFPGMSIKAARKEARAVLEDAAGGIDRAATRPRSDTPAGTTFADVAADYINRHAKRNMRARSWKEAERILTRGRVAAAWGGREIAGIGTRDVLDVLDDIADNGGRDGAGAPIMANRTRSYLSMLYVWAKGRGIVTESPVAAVAAPAKETARDRWLDDREIEAAWAAFHAVGFPFGGLFRFLLATGARLNEAARMRWADVDLEGRTWTLPKEAMKGGREQVVHLNELALEVLGGVPRFSGGHVFSTDGGRTPVSGFSRGKSRADKRLAEAAEREKAEGGVAVKMAPWRIHDLRRTVATHLAGLGVNPHIIAAVLGHSMGAVMGVTNRYVRHPYREETAAALDRWGRKLAALTGQGAPNNVVSLRSRRA